MKVYVTGADGLLGSNLVRLLLVRGHTVRALLFNGTSSRTLDGLDMERVYGDILDPSSLGSMAGCDAVIHAAARTDVWPSRSESVRKVNIEGTRNVIDAALKNGVQRMIYVGSGSSVNTQASEGNYRFPGAKFGLDYLDSKYEALQLVLQAAQTQGLPALAVLPSFMIGAYDSLPSSGKLILTLARGKLKFYSGGGRNFIHVNDVAACIANGLDRGTVGRYYLACNENLTYKAFLAKVSAVVNRPAPRFGLPDWAVKAAGLMGSLMGHVSGKPPVLSFPAARIACERQYVDSDDAVTELQMPRTPIDIAIRDCHRWFADNGYLESSN